jgi:DmsE family decaheme c-type cytochrome
MNAGVTGVWGLRAALLCLGTALLLQPRTGLAQEGPTGEQSPPPPAAAKARDCGDCHQERVATLKTSSHSALDSLGLASRADARSSCTACHGEQGNRYSFEGGLPSIAKSEGCRAVFAFNQAETPAVKGSRCLTCHRKDHPQFHASRHATAGLDCTSCHSICAQRGSSHWPLQKALTQYGSALSADHASIVCAECHGDVFAQFQQSEHHRLEEGVVECTSCHDPHKPQSREQLGGFKQEQCGNCHTDKSGPFVFEHPPSRVEGCVACHTPHGSPNRHMLVVQSVSELCFSCHAAVPGFHSRFDASTVCTNCHSSIHGSFLSPFFLK